MNFNDHSNLKGFHAFLSASKYHWLNYSDEKLVDSYFNARAAQEGIELHDIAAVLIEKRIKLPKTNKTLNMYVNDAIAFKMIPEQVLYFSENCFGTADAICFRKNFLRIHDYKSGVTPAKIEQLLIYDALFCLEYGIAPGDIGHELRIYQNDEVLCHNPEADEIGPIMDKIIRFDKIISEINHEE